MGNKRFSIIVPIYKVEAYLDKCVESVLTQTYKDFELIIVDDGSPDKCPQMCDEWAKRDNHIKVIHKKNGGLSDARNAGLDIAQGEYVLFLDSDDYWIDESLLYDIDKQVVVYNNDVVLYGSRTVFFDGTWEQRTSAPFDYDYFNSCNKENALEYLWNTQRIPGAAWIMCVKRQLIEDHKLRFVVGVTAEDYEWIVAILMYSYSIVKIKGVQHAYLKRPGSITTTAKLSGIVGTMNALDFSNSQKFRNDGVTKFLARIYLISIMSYNHLPEEDKKAASKLLSDHLYILKDAGQTAYFLFVRIFGFAIFSKIIRIAYNVVR